MDNEARNAHEGAEYPANPFVALADFALVLFFIFLLAYASLRVGNETLTKRVAVEQLQGRLYAKMEASMNQLPDANLRKNWRRRFNLFKFDGDLQRYWFDGDLFYGDRAERIGTPAGKELLIAFGKALAACQGNPDDPGSGMFKRIIVEGNADRVEGDDLTVWRLSLSRAQDATLILQTKAGIHPKLLEASGRGCWEPRKLRGDIPDNVARPENRRLEILVVFAPGQAQEYLRREAVRRGATR